MCLWTDHRISQDSMNNMSHSALVHLITEFFYAPLLVGTAFSKVFSHEVPRVAVCLAATAVEFCSLFFCSFACSLMSLTALGSPGWVHSHWPSAGPPIRICCLFKSLHWLLGHAKPNWLRPEACCKDKETVCCLGIGQQVCDLYYLLSAKLISRAEWYLKDSPWLYLVMSSM